MTTSNGKQKIAILGGGVGALSTAFGLTSVEGWDERYEITVYQMGWRLGGKGASGRNGAHSERIEEHGLHMWMGFYDNAFKVMQECYAETKGGDSPFQSWDDAFKPHCFEVLTEVIKGEPCLWPVDLPTNDEIPGQGNVYLEPWEYVVMILELLKRSFEKSDVGGNRGLRHRLAAAVGRPTPLRWLSSALIGTAARLSAPILLEVACRVARKVGRLIAAASAESRSIIAREIGGLLGLLERFLKWLAKELVHDLEDNDTARRLFTTVDLGIATVRGILVDEIPFKGFDSIDDIEFKAWLKKHGASEISLRSPALDGVYKGNFSFIKGAADKPDFAAGVALQSFLRIFLCYKGAVSYKMQAGMGDVVFTPLYRVLRARGVRFEFFHKVKKLHYDRTTNSIPRIDFEKQVKLVHEGEAVPYDPLVPVKKLLCWPSKPRYEQIVDGSELEAAEINLESNWAKRWKDTRNKSLHKGTDYDLIVLGISIGALGTICKEIIDEKSRWQEMIDNVETVQTQAAQFWMHPDVAGLGWSEESPLLTNYPSTYSTWLDASQVLDREDWKPDQVGSVAYFCNVMEDPEVIPPPDDHAFPARQLQRVTEAAEVLLDENIATLWPDAVGKGNSGFNWALLESYFLRANIDPSERFVLSSTGKTCYRLKTGEADVEDLYLTGDWIRNGFNVGCVESTVISGLQCSRRICGSPKEIIGEHFFRFTKEEY